VPTEPNKLIEADWPPAWRGNKNYAMATVVDDRRPLKVCLVIGTVALALIWAYWTTLGELARTWRADPQYSHGFLVPLIALVVLWQKRAELFAVAPQPSWYGVPLLLLAAAMHLVGTYFYSPWLASVSLLAGIAGACWALGGWRTLGQVWPAIAFLLFM